MAIHLCIEEGGNNCAGTELGTTKLVTRPLTRFKNMPKKLCFPVDAGVHEKAQNFAAKKQITNEWIREFVSAPQSLPDYDEINNNSYFMYTSAFQRLAANPATPNTKAAVYMAPESWISFANEELPESASNSETMTQRVTAIQETLKELYNFSKANYLSVQRIKGMVYSGIASCEALAELKNSKDENSAAYEATHAPETTASSTDRVRGGIWKDMLRELAITNDRLWIFVRTLSGTMGEDASSLLSEAGEETQRAQRALDAERKAIAEKVAALQGKLIEVLVQNLMRTSKLEMLPTNDAEQTLMVLDGEAAKQMRDLASGESGRPFFEANVAIQSMLRNTGDNKLPLSTLIKSFNGIIQQIHGSFEAELLGKSSASLGQLAEARNSYLVSLRPDVTAAIRSSLDRFHHEMRGSRPSLWELVEGASATLSASTLAPHRRCSTASAQTTPT